METTSFGEWLRRRRRALDLTQEDLAQRVGCAAGTIRKIESDERRPSRQLAELLADHLAIPAAERLAFLQAARAELAVDRLAAPTPPADQAGGPAGRPLPSGTVTFLFTDVEGSTQLWEQHPEAMPDALARHDAILRVAIEAHGGVVFHTVGDAFCAAFGSARDALAAALTAQRGLHTEPWRATGPLHVRMALHTGVIERAGADYQGLPLSRVARLLAAGHGGQVLLSRATQELVREHVPPEVALRDLGEHRLKDLTYPEQIFQLVTPDLPTDFPPLTTLSAYRTNLPAQPTALIGRAAEVRSVADLLRHTDVRLVTLTGPGGIGKTRLALQSAAELLDACADGVWFVNLVPIRDPVLVVSAIAQTLGIKETGSQPLLDSLKTSLRDKHLLLLLDNFEQVVDAAPQVAEVLAAAAHLKVLVTSRAVLHLSAEHAFPVAPLALPDRTPLPPLERLCQYAAVDLFIQRALAVKPDFAITTANAPTVAEICYRLDGLPLAIELAATRVKLFAPEALLKRLAQRLPLLTGGARDLPQRQQTLRSAIEWSYDLLEAGEQLLFRRLAVFVGGCPLEAAEAICNASGDLDIDVLEQLAALVDKSLLRQGVGADGEPRFTMLETIREYALEQLERSREAEAIRQYHANFFLVLAEAAEPKLTSGDRAVWLEGLDVENNNLRAALQWALVCDKAELALRLAGALQWFWYFRGSASEGRGWVNRAVAHPRAAEHPLARAKALAAAGFLAVMQGDWLAARPQLEASVALFQEIGHGRGLAYALLYLGAVAFWQGDHMVGRTQLEASIARFRECGDQWGLATALSDLGDITASLGDYAGACARYEEALALFRDLGDPWGTAVAILDLGWAAVAQGDWVTASSQTEQAMAILREVGDKWLLAQALHILGDVARSQGNDVRARALVDESLALRRELGDKQGIAGSLHSLGCVAQSQGEYAQATALHRESLALFQELGQKQHSVPVLEGLARVSVAQGQPGRAARLFGAVAGLREALNTPRSPVERGDYDRLVAAIRAQLDAATCDAAWAAGRALTLEQAIAFAFGKGARGIELPQQSQVPKVHY